MAVAGRVADGRYAREIHFVLTTEAIILGENRHAKSQSGSTGTTSKIHGVSDPFLDVFLLDHPKFGRENLSRALQMWISGTLPTRLIRN